MNRFTKPSATIKNHYPDVKRKKKNEVLLHAAT